MRVPNLVYLVYLVYFLAVGDGNGMQSIQGDDVQEELITVPVGTMIRGRYIVKGLLGKNDSGAIYLVEDQRTRSELFALKEVIFQSKHELYRSLLEYQLLVRLDHPALAHVHSLLKGDQRHRAYLLMEYIEGSNLETLRQQQPEQRFSWVETMNIMASIIAAVNYLHGQQPPIIHSDIKPTNIIMPKAGGRAILVDFGTAKHYDLDSPTTTVRSYYRAPEQYTTGPDLQTDIYGLGATFYTLVTGIMPADAPSRLTQVSNGEIDPLQPLNEVLPTVPAHIARAIDRAMALDADNRFLSVERFWEALWSLVEYPATVSKGLPSTLSHPASIPRQAVVRPAVVSVPKQPRAPRAWKFGPFWPFTAKQAVARPAVVSTPKQRAPRIEKPGALRPLAAEQTVTRPDTISLPKHPPTIPSSEPTISEQAVEEATPRSVVEQQHMAPTSEPAVAEQVIEEPAPALMTEQLPLISPSEPAIPEQAVEATAPTSEPAVAEQVVEATAPRAVEEQPHSAPTLGPAVAEEPTSISVVEQLQPVLPSEPAVAEQVVEEPAPALVAEQPSPVPPSEPTISEQVVEEPAPALVAEQPSPVSLLEPAVPEQVVEEPVPALVAEQPSLVSPLGPAVPEQAVEEAAPALVAEQWRVALTSVAEQAVERRARALEAKQQHALSGWRLAVLLILLVAVIVLGIRAANLSGVLTHPAPASVTSTPRVSSLRPTPTPVPTTYPTLAGTYKGTIYDIPANVRTSLSLTDVRQNQRHISGILTVGPGLLGYGSFSGTIDAAKHLKFTLTDSDGNPMLFFEGSMQSATSLSGDYYRCNPVQGSSCVRGPVGYGLWNVVASFTSGTSTGTNPSPGL